MKKIKKKSVKETSIKNRKDKSKLKFIIGLCLLSLIFGILGGGLASKVIVPYLLKKLGQSEEIIIPEKYEKIKVEEESAIIDAIRKVSPAVCSITSERSVYDIFGDVTTQKSGGTGFILTSDGYILTNKHVTSDKNAKYTVLTSDGQDYKAKVVAYDPLNDLAVLKIEAKNLSVVEIGDSSDLKIGQRVIAIGNALGEFQNTVTVGVVSAKGRAVTAGDGLGSGERLENLIQTDAAINPGNSGGPLVNLAGQVVGINTAMAKAENIGFAIPINIVKPIDNFINNLEKKGKIIRPMIGIRYISITKELASLNNLPVKEGALVYGGVGELAVIPGSPAALAGIKEGDIILAIGDDEINPNYSLSQIIQEYQPGDEIELKILRNGKELRLKLTLVEYK